MDEITFEEVYAALCETLYTKTGDDEEQTLRRKVLAWSTVAAVSTDEKYTEHARVMYAKNYRLWAERLEEVGQCKKR